MPKQIEPTSTRGFFSSFFPKAPTVDATIAGTVTRSTGLTAVGDQPMASLVSAPGSKGIDASGDGNYALTLLVVAGCAVSLIYLYFRSSNAAAERADFLPTAAATRDSSPVSDIPSTTPDIRQVASNNSGSTALSISGNATINNHYAGSALEPRK
ncbi:MAG: hypothetical protein Q7V63_08885 [Gammaproteobacteria bacterium]|nr:hypothetical protein [Gammaproteobacteria bacterium]